MKKADFLVEKIMLFFFGAAIGALFFMAVYGTRILDINYDSWILRSSDYDIKQHYIGFLHFINSPWTFPFGMVDTLSYPCMMSVVWTDSIPGLCVLVKIFRFMFPKVPQLFGIFGMVTFALNGGFASLLCYRVTGRRAVAIFASPFFILSFTVLQRLYYHTALSCHWIILAALLYFFTDRKYNIKKDAVIYGLFSIICVSVHSYFLPMAGGILLFDTVYINYDKKKKEGKMLIPLLSFCVCGLIMLYLYGAFSSPVEHGGFAIGGYNSNLNTLFNSMGKGILPELINRNDLQYEGFGYLGLGMLIMTTMALIILACRVISVGIKASWSILKRHVRILLTILMGLFFLVIAVFPEADLNDIVLIPDFIPFFIKKLLGIFRSNGRFIWPLMYIIMLSSLYVLFRYTKKTYIAYIFFAVCLLLQLADVRTYAAEKHEIFTKDYEYSCLLDEYGPDRDSYDHIIMTFDNGDLRMDMGYFAVLYDKTINRFYFARVIDNVIEDNLTKYREKLHAGKGEPGNIYVFNDETIKEWDVSGLQIEKINENLILGY